tara:strand:- start:708 stop:2054 length:1347 start_codon:yes stop_codon:yes gene_type:complete
MFKYGGPIKEGIMHGMRESKKNGGRMLLAGEHPQQFKDASGREQHFGPLIAFGSGLMSAARALPVVYRGIRTASKFSPSQSGGYFRNLFPTGRFRNVTPTISRTKERTVPNASGSYSGIKIDQGKPLGLFQALRDPTRLGQAIRENPFTAGTIGVGAAGQIKNIPDIASGAAGLVADTGLGIANYLLGTDFKRGKKDDIKTTDDTGGIKRLPKDKVVTAPETGGTGGAGDDSKKEINEARIEENRQKYYKLMGIDKMKKGAVYDSLIDASNIIQKEGGDLKGAIKSGSLQNQIINAISKNLDKSVDLKKSIDAAILKGEIQKDINQTKPSAFAEQVQYIRNNPNDPLAKKLSGMRSVADDLAALADKPITSDIVSRLVQSKGTDVAGIIKDDKYQKWEKNNEGDEIDYLQDVYKGKKLEEGIYIINKKAISIDKDGFASPLDLDSIIG